MAVNAMAIRIGQARSAAQYLIRPADTVPEAVVIE
jgi:hypothetical protein